MKYKKLQPRSYVQPQEVNLHKTRHPKAIDLWTTVHNSTIYGRYRITRQPDNTYLYTEGWTVHHAETKEQAQQEIDQLQDNG